MAEDIGKQLGRFFKGIRDKTAETVARQEAIFARGKVAGTSVYADDGTLIVDAGHIIDESVLSRAERAGKLGAVVISAGTAKVQDFREKASETLGSTQDGQEARNLDSVDEFREAMAYVGRYSGVDVTDIRGNVIVPAEKKLDAEDVRAAREAGLLSALIYSAQKGHAPRPEDAGPAPIAWAAVKQAPQKRASLPLVGPDSDSD